MRAGGACALQQALTASAAAVVKQAVLQAKRRGHAQVTPLHVANTMLSAPRGLFRAACLVSHSHPLQCKALELCFNVALNRLPAAPSSSSSSNPMLNPHHHHHHDSQNYPSISNALVAAFKRAQAHQRRGSVVVETQQQTTLLAVKIELDQLVISILDDPSVSRVMREAGFSSTQVKSNVEKAVSSELCSQRSSPNNNNNNNNNMRCRNGYNNNSLENVWGLHPVTIPANTLGLSLPSPERDEQIVVSAENQSSQLSCCADCSAKFETEAQNLQTTLSRLPSWLINKDESRKLNYNNQNQNTDAIKELCKKWNSFCSSAHKLQPNLSLEETLKFSSINSSSCFSYLDHHQQNPDLTRTHFSSPDPTPKDNNHQRCWTWTPNLLHIMQENGNSRNAFSSTSEIMERGYNQKLKEFNAENLNIICNALEKKVPFQKEIIPEIAGTILQCRSGMLRRRKEDSNNNNNNAKQETWLFFLGPDVAQAKERISKELAKVVFGSYSSFLSFGTYLSSFVLTTTTTSGEYCRNKRVRDEENCKSYFERFCGAVSENPHRVFFLEDFEQTDFFSQMGIKRAIESGRIRNENGEEFGFCDAIIVLSCESFKSRSSSSSSSISSACSWRDESGYGAGAGTGAGTAGEVDKTRRVSLDLNISFDGDGDQDQAVDDRLGIFENVDKQVVFKTQDL